MNTIQSIRQNKHKIRVTNYRFVDSGKLLTIRDIREAGKQKYIKATGGKVVLELTTKDGKDFSAESVCSASDHFNRKQGIQLALERLAKQVGDYYLSSI